MHLFHHVLARLAIFILRSVPIARLLPFTSTSDLCNLRPLFLEGLKLTLPYTFIVLVHLLSGHSSSLFMHPVETWHCQTCINRYLGIIKILSLLAGKSWLRYDRIELLGLVPWVIMPLLSTIAHQVERLQHWVYSEILIKDARSKDRLLLLLQGALRSWMHNASYLSDRPALSTRSIDCSSNADVSIRLLLILAEKFIQRDGALWAFS